MPINPKNPGTALITGASAGLGEEFARQLAAQNYDLLLVARRLDRLHSLAQELTDLHGIQVQALAADLATSEGVETVEAAIGAANDLSLLINNAGFGVSGGFQGAALEKHLAMIHVHINAAVRLTYAALPGMVTRQRGGFINVSSISAFLPMRSTTYSASKAYLVNFSQALAFELAETGLRVQALCPGFTYTEFHDTPEYGSFKRTRIPSILWLDASYVVRYSLKNLDRGPVVCVPGWIYKLAHFFAREPLSASLLRFIALRVAGKYL
jgi:hypothetical protein